MLLAKGYLCDVAMKSSRLKRDRYPYSMHCKYRETGTLGVQHAEIEKGYESLISAARSARRVRERR